MFVKQTDRKTQTDRGKTPGAKSRIRNEVVRKAGSKPGHRRSKYRSCKWQVADAEPPEVSASVASAFLSRSRMLARGLRGASRLSVLRTAPLAPRALAARGLAGKIVDGENICPR